MDRRILVIEKDIDCQKTLRRILSRGGTLVTIVSDITRALDTLRSDTFDVVIACIRMDGRTEIEFVRELKAIDEDVEVIILTGTATVNNAVRAMKTGGIFDILTKPLKNVDTLLDSVDQALQKRREKRTLPDPGRDNPGTFLQQR